MNAQEIIIYRNPGEAMFWDSIASGRALPFLLWFLLTFVIISILHKQANKFLNKYPMICILGAMVCSGFCSYFLFSLL